MPDGLALLTTRELEIFHLLCDSEKVKQIAVRLNLSVKTVEVHKYNLMRKLDVHRTAHLARLGLPPQRANAANPNPLPTIEKSTNI
jgi:DNA-binding NarL/FixJ family response regulator